MGSPTDTAIFAGGTLTLGGTTMGTTVAVALEFVGVLDDLPAEEFAGEVWDQVYMGEEWICTAILTNYDTDALGKYFPNTSGGKPVYPGSFAHGSLMSSVGYELKLTPLDGAHSGFTMFNALPQLASTVIPFNAYEPLYVEMTWLGVRNSSGKVVDL